MKKVLIVVDMQNDFITGALGSPQAQAAVEGAALRLEEQRARQWPVIFTADTHPQDEFDGAISQEGKRIPPHCVKGTFGWEIVPALSPLPGERVVEKGSFGSLDLAGAIGALDEGDVIELCGVCTDICVISNALHLRACYPGNRVAVLENACAGTTGENHQAALSVMRSCLVDVE